MLMRMIIENLALIHKLELNFQSGLTIISGETGAGKSILIQAISALLGEPVHAQTVQTGAVTARVEGEFNLPKTVSGNSRFEDLQILLEPPDILRLTREIHRTGRDRYLVNEQIVKKADFQWLGQQLLDVNSQHSHQYLLRPKNHLELFDSAISDPSLLASLGSAFVAWQETSGAYRRMKETIDEMAKRRQLIEYQINEIDEANLHSGEKEELIEERERLRYAEEIRNNLNEAHHLLENGPVALADNAARVAAMIERTVQRDAQLMPLFEQAESMSVMARDLSGEIEKAMARATVSPDRLEVVSERLYLLQQLEGKFRNSIEGILKYRREIGRESEGYSGGQKDLKDLESKTIKAMTEYCQADQTMSAHRRAAAPQLCRRIESALTELGMKHASFDVSMRPQWQMDITAEPFVLPDRCTERGTDQMEFMMSANPGIPLKPLSQIASGGELSRVMLALKQYLVEVGQHKVMVFDEVDAGIGGDVANAVGEKLRLLSSDQQILCVTHLPQIAVRGHQHIRVEKHSDGVKTSVSMTVLDSESRVREIARMLGGDENVSSAVKHAESMLHSVRNG